MVLAVSSGLTLISSEDGTSADNWDEATTSDYVEGQREGTGYVGYDVDIETLHNFDIVTTIVADVTGYHYGRWLRISNAGDVDLKSNGGIQLALRDGAGNESYFYVGGSDTYAGGWAYFVVDLSRTPDANNGANAVITNAADIGVGFKMLTKSGDDNCHIDAGHYGTSGLIVTGTPDTGTYGANNAWQEVFDLVDAADLGLMAKQAGSFVLKGPVTIGDNIGTLSTTFNDTDHIIFFADLPVAADFYNIEVVGNGTGTTDVALAGFINKTEGATGGELKFGNVVTSFSLENSTFLTDGAGTYYGGTLVRNKLVRSGTSSFLAGAIADGWTFDACSAITLNTTAQLINSEISNCVDAVSVFAEDLARVTGNDFESDGSNHAVELSSIGAGAMSWDNTLTGYVAGVTGSPITPSATGNEAIFVNVASGTLTINVGANATVPSIRSAGAIVNVVAGQSDLTFTIDPSYPDYEYRVYEVTAKGSLTGSVEVQGIEQTSIATNTYSYTHVIGKFLAVQIIPHANDFVENTSYYDSSATDQIVTINLTKDTNN